MTAASDSTGGCRSILAAEDAERPGSTIECVGSYIRIWERLVSADTGKEVVARDVHREPPPSG
jgi:hypothetical protein